MTDDERELFTERLAIAEFDGGADQQDALAIAKSHLAQHRHACEVRWCCANPSKVNEYVAAVRARRGNEAADKLLADAREQYRRGNRGEPNKWL